MVTDTIKLISLSDMPEETNTKITHIQHTHIHMLHITNNMHTSYH